MLFALHLQGALERIPAVLGSEEGLHSFQFIAGPLKKKSVRHKFTHASASQCQYLLLLLIWQNRGLFQSKKKKKNPYQCPPSWFQSIGLHFRGANTAGRFKAVGKFEFLDQTPAHWTRRGLCYHLQSLTNTGVWSHHRWNNVCRQLGSDVLHLIPAERCPVWTFEAHRTHKQIRSERNSFTIKHLFYYYYYFTATQRSGWKKTHDALFPPWLSGWSRAWLNTCCVAQWLLNEARRYPSCGGEVAHIQTVNHQQRTRTMNNSGNICAAITGSI